MRVRLAPFLSVPLLAALVAVAACSNEAEGEPCSRDNNNDDCQDGYACVVPPNPHATNAPYVCCPGLGQTPTASECMTNSSYDGGNHVPPDGSTVPDTSMATDGPTESTTSDVKSESSATDSSSASDSSDGGPG
jgi:hypothetical protein